VGTVKFAGTQEKGVKERKMRRERKVKAKQTHHKRRVKGKTSREEKVQEVPPRERINPQKSGKFVS